MPPKELDDTLTSLPLRVGVYVPDDLLEDWFAPGPGMNPASPAALAAAARYARRFDCEFIYYPERQEGVLWKWVPAIEHDGRLTRPAGRQWSDRLAAGSWHALGESNPSLHRERVAS